MPGDAGNSFLGCLLKAWKSDGPLRVKSKYQNCHDGQRRKKSKDSRKWAHWNGLNTYDWKKIYQIIIFYGKPRGQDSYQDQKECAGAGVAFCAGQGWLERLSQSTACWQQPYDRTLKQGRPDRRRGCYKLGHTITMRTSKIEGQPRKSDTQSRKSRQNRVSVLG